MWRSNMLVMKFGGTSVGGPERMREIITLVFDQSRVTTPPVVVLSAMSGVTNLLIEAAQLAGRFSQASEDTKVVIHYTERKFLSKPKGAAPGLVRMSSFRSITVEPKESVKRI